MLELISNPNMLGRFLKYAALTPLILKFIEKVEDEQIPSEEKRAKVIRASMLMVDQLAKRGYIPASVIEGTEKIAGELTDVSVAIYNGVGFFESKNESKKKKKS